MKLNVKLHIYLYENGGTLHKYLHAKSACALCLGNRKCWFKTC